MAARSNVITMPEPKPALQITVCCSPCLIHYGLQQQATYRVIRTYKTVEAGRCICTEHLHAYQVPLHYVIQIQPAVSTAAAMPTIEREQHLAPERKTALHGRICKKCNQSPLSHRNTTGTCTNCQKQEHGVRSLCRVCGTNYVHRNNESQTCKPCKRKHRVMRPQDRPKCRRCHVATLHKRNRTGLCSGCRPFLTSMGGAIRRKKPRAQSRKKSTARKRK